MYQNDIFESYSEVLNTTIITANMDKSNKRKVDGQQSTKSTPASKKPKRGLQLNFRDLAKKSSSDLRYIGQLVNNATKKVLAKDADSATRAEFSCDFNVVPAKISSSKDFCFLLFMDSTGSFSMGVYFDKVQKVLEEFQFDSRRKKQPISVCIHIIH